MPRPLSSCCSNLKNPLVRVRRLFRTRSSSKHVCTKKVQHFDEFINSMHEGTNYAIRLSFARVGLSTNIENCIVILNNNSERTMELKSIKKFKKFQGKKLYSKLICSQNLLPSTYCMLEKLWFWCFEYYSVCASSSEWLVTHKNMNMMLKEI